LPRSLLRFYETKLQPNRDFSRNPLGAKPVRLSNTRSRCRPAPADKCGYNGAIPPAGTIGQKSPQQFLRNSRHVGRVESTMAPENLVSPVNVATGADSRVAFEHFSRRLIGLARIHLDERMQRKVDPEDVVQSVYKSVLRRYGAEALATDEWEGLWGLLTLITIRKCADRARYHAADCRNLDRDVEAPGSADSNASWFQAVGREPTPDEALVLAETVEELLSSRRGDERAIVELSLHGYSTQEISQQMGRAERSVRRIREQVREHLEHRRAEAAI